MVLVWSFNYRIYFCVTFKSTCLSTEQWFQLLFLSLLIRPKWRRCHSLTKPFKKQYPFVNLKTASSLRNQSTSLSITFSFSNLTGISRTRVCLLPHTPVWKRNRDVTPSVLYLWHVCSNFLSSVWSWSWKWRIVLQLLLVSRCTVLTIWLK